MLKEEVKDLKAVAHGNNPHLRGVLEWPVTRVPYLA